MTSRHASDDMDATSNAARMSSCGYVLNSMVPVDDSEALWCFSAGMPVYRLYPDGTASLIRSSDEIRNHVKADILFAVKNECFEKAMKR